MSHAVRKTSAITATKATGMRGERTHGQVRFERGRGRQLRSGDDYVVEFLGYRFSFNADDFEQRVTAAAVKLGLLGGNELDDDETADLVELVERDVIEEPRSRSAATSFATGRRSPSSAASRSSTG